MQTNRLDVNVTVTFHNAGRYGEPRNNSDMKSPGSIYDDEHGTLRLAVHQPGRRDESFLTVEEVAALPRVTIRPFTDTPAEVVERLRQAGFPIEG